MAENPILANGRVTWLIQVGSLTHKHQYYVDALYNVTPGVSNLFYYDGSQVAFTGHVTQYKPFLAEAYDTNTEIVSATLEQYVAGAYIPRQVVAVGLAGGETPPSTLASSVIGTWRDEDFNLVRIYWLGAFGALPRHTAVPSNVSAGFTDVVAEWNTHSAGHVGYIAVSRADKKIVAFDALTSALNRKSRRRLSLV